MFPTGHGRNNKQAKKIICEFPINLSILKVAILTIYIWKLLVDLLDINMNCKSENKIHEVFITQPAQ